MLASTLPAPRSLYTPHAIGATSRPLALNYSKVCLEIRKRLKTQCAGAGEDTSLAPEGSAAVKYNIFSLVAI
jgi:hypothetical protein